MTEENEERSEERGAQEDQEDQEELEDTVNAERARLLVAREGAQALDVRPQDEFAESHVPGAANAGPDDLDSALEGLSKEKPVIVVCADGKQSAEVAERLRDDGWNAAALEGGMSSWESDSLPTQPAEDQEFEGPRRPGPLGH